MIPGLSYRKEGQSVHNPARALIKDLDALPFPARHLFPPLTAYKGLPSFVRKIVGNLPVREDVSPIARSATERFSQNFSSAFCGKCRG
jgi:hypothetical protein